MPDRGTTEQPRKLGEGGLRPGESYIKNSSRRWCCEMDELIGELDGSE